MPGLSLSASPVQQDSARTVSQVLDWHLENERRDFSPTALTERRRVLCLFRAVFGNLAISECRLYHLLEFINSQPGLKSNHSRRRWKATVCRPFGHAAQVGFIDRNPFAGLRLQEGPVGRDWTDAEYRAILKTVRPYFRRFIVYLRFSGSRPGEARSLKWPDVLWDCETAIHMEHKTSRITKEPRRIYMNAVISKLLHWMQRNKKHATYVFVNGRGRPWTCGALTKHLRTVRVRAKLPDSVKLHGGRHTFCTHGIMNGVDPPTMAELLGHRDVKSTARYLHLINKRKHLNAAANRAVGLSG